MTAAEGICPSARALITAVILAGGRGQRLGGVDKGLVPLNGRPLIEHVLDAIRGQVAEVLISANRNRERYARYGFPVIADGVAGFAGPLAGLHAAWPNVRTPYVMTVACDTPLIPGDMAQRLLDGLLRENAGIALVHDGQRSHPTLLLADARLHGSLDAFLGEGKRKIDAWTARHREVLVDFSDCPAAFANINTPEELKDLTPAVEKVPKLGAGMIGSRPPVDRKRGPGGAPDVRMRGFTARVSVADALTWVDAVTDRLEPEVVPTENATGRVLYEDLHAPIDVPAFDRSAVDGYALRGAQTPGADQFTPLQLSVVGEVFAGHAHPTPMPEGCALRIMTGAPLPAGADTVVPAEYCEERNGIVEITTACPVGRNVGLRGEDVRQGDLLLTQGRRLRPQDTGLLASLGLANVAVVRHPRVRIIVTGDELAAPGAERAPHQIFDSNSFLLRGLVGRDGGVIERVLQLDDGPDPLRAALEAPGVEMILIAGGSSVGAEDHAPALLAERGELAIHGIAMRPSCPTGMGRIGDTLVFLLPGNPVSCLCAYDFFAGRALRRLGGRSPDWPYRVCRLPLARKLVSAIGRVDYCRVRVTPDGVVPLALSGASILSSTTVADGFVIIPPEPEGYGAGTQVEVHLYDE
ncbi:MAG: gephyrin-like molybdotransferase Glp [Thioalkalivibrio sp.]